MNTDNLCFGQKYDESLGILFPWYSHGVLEVISKWDLSDKIVMEWGGGASTVWWAEKAIHVYSVDHSEEWLQKISESLSLRNISNKCEVLFIDTHEGDHTNNRDNYVKSYPYIKPNICIVDGIHRYECAEYAVKVLKPEILIVDNHQQDYVFICPKLDELLEGVRMERFIQPDHTNHEGRPWATAIFYLNEKA